MVFNMTVLFYAIVAAVCLMFLLSFSSLAPWLPTRSKDMERISRLAGVKGGGVFYEIGCGTAALSQYIARNNPEAKVVGVELAFPLFLFSRLRCMLYGPKNLKIIFGDAFNRNYSDADAVYVFGLPETVNGRLRDKMAAELKPGAKYISYIFEVNDWKGSSCFLDKPSETDAGINVCVK